MRTMLFVMLGGAVGAAARYGVDGVVSTRAGGAFPWGTFAINVSGCFVIGVLSVLLTNRFTVDPAVRTALTVGVVGSYTTFSTLMFETSQLAGARSYGLAVLNVLGTVIAGGVALLAGIVLGRVL